MSFRTRVLEMVDVMMRVPPILLIDEILKIGLGIPVQMDAGNVTFPIMNNTTVYSTNISAINTDRNISDIPLINTTNANKKLTSTFAPLMGMVVNTTAANPSLEQVIADVSLTSLNRGMLDTSLSTLIEILATSTCFVDILSVTLIKIAICLLGLFLAIGIFMLWTRHLVMVYMFIISLGLTFLSHWSNVTALELMGKQPHIFEDILSMNKTRLENTGVLLLSVLPYLLTQWLMGMFFAYIHLGPRLGLLQKYMPLIFASPILLAMWPLDSRLIKCQLTLSGAIPLLLTKIILLSSGIEASKTVYNGYQYALNFISNYGISAFIENEWQRLNVPTVLRVFWTIRITHDFIDIMMKDSSNMSSEYIMQTLLVNGCDTLTSVLGMASIISLICRYIGQLFQWYLLTIETDEVKLLGTVSAVLFYILALQTGLTSLSSEKRFVRLCRNLWLLSTALLHFLHNIVSPILMSLSAARNPSSKRHFRALSVCAFLLIAPISLLTYLWHRHQSSTWLLAVTAFSIEVIVKVLVSLATYTLFLLDAQRQSFWEKLDDYLYYVRAFGNSVEFCFGILLFFNGAWILIFESGGAIRAIMMCIHAYFNIWCEAREGWTVFMKRRSAVYKISTLPEATPNQLQDFDDVCAICYQEMFTAKITRCRHYFHGVCLRKWLYVQDRCPLCHEIMMYTDTRDENTNAQSLQGQERENLHDLAETERAFVLGH